MQDDLTGEGWGGRCEHKVQMEITRLESMTVGKSSGVLWRRVLYSGGKSSRVEISMLDVARPSLTDSSNLRDGVHVMDKKQTRPPPL